MNRFQKKKDTTIKKNSFLTIYQIKFIFIILFGIGISLIFFQIDYNNYYLFAQQINNTNTNNNE